MGRLEVVLHRNLIWVRAIDDEFCPGPSALLFLSPSLVGVAVVLLRFWGGAGDWWKLVNRTDWLESWVLDKLPKRRAVCLCPTLTPQLCCCFTSERKTHSPAQHSHPTTTKRQQITVETAAFCTPSDPNQRLNEIICRSRHQLITTGEEELQFANLSERFRPFMSGFMSAEYDTKLRR